jgi:DNA-binding HxlR family transcriptional regulator
MVGPGRHGENGYALARASWGSLPGTKGMLLGFGVTRFSDIQANTGAPRATLAARLRELEDAGLVERRRYSSRPPRDEYLLTPAGQELGPVLRELRAWGERHARQTTAAETH